VGIRFDNIDLPEPGGPIIKILWPPDTATSDRALHVSLAFHIGEIGIVILVSRKKSGDIGASWQQRNFAAHLKLSPRL
jgi:hypothetical protein